MNPLDIVFIVILGLGALMGMKLRLIGAAFIVLGVLVGWLLASQFSDDIGELFADSLSNDTLVTVISYAIIIVGALILANVAGKIILRVLSVFTLGLSGLVDKLGGLALGLLIGVAISGAIILGLARLTYNFSVATIAEGIPGQVAKQVIREEDVKGVLENALTGSQLVPVFIDVTDALTANALGYVPSDFKVALDILKEKIEGEQAPAQ